MSARVKASISFKGVDKSGIMAQIFETEAEALNSVKPLIESVLVATIGTQYYSLSALKAMGNPYKIGGTPPLPRGVINKQSGNFFDSIRQTGPTRNGDQIEINVVGGDPEKVRLLDGGGASKMVPRPWQALVRSRLRRKVAAQLGSYLQSHLRVSVRRNLPARGESE